MDFFELAINKLKDELTKEHTQKILDSKLLAVRLRGRLIDDKEDVINSSPLRQAIVSDFAEQDKNLVWLETGGLLETDFKKNEQNHNSDLGFSVNSLLDYQAIRPYVINSTQTIEDILKGTFLELPFKAKNIQELLPGTSFQLRGKGQANFSAKLPLTKSVVNLSFKTGGQVSGEFSLRITRGEENKVSVILSIVKKKTFSSDVKVSAGLDLPASTVSGLITNYSWYSKGSEILDSPTVGKYSSLLKSNKNVKKFKDFFDEDSLEKKIAEILQDYTNFYASLGTTSSCTDQHLTKFTFDLDDPEACDAYEALCRLDDKEAEAIWKDNKDVIERFAYNSVESIDQTNAESGFNGKKLLMANILRSSRAGYLMYDNQMKIIQLEKATTKKLLFNNNQSLQWEGFHTTLDNRPEGLDYWRLLYSKEDTMVSFTEVVTFNRFAALLGIAPYDETKLEQHHFLKQLFTKQDNCHFSADIFITEDGLNKIAYASTEDIRKAWISVAEKLGKVAPGLPYQDHHAITILKSHRAISTGRGNDNYQDDASLQVKKQQYYSLVSTQGQKRNIYQDAQVLADCEEFRKTCLQKLDNNDRRNWNTVFISYAKDENNNFMVVITALAYLATLTNVLIANLELKRSKTGKIILNATDSKKVKTGDEIFNDAQKQMMTNM